MAGKKDMTFHDRCIQLIGYTFVMLSVLVFAGFVGVVALQPTGFRVADALMLGAVGVVSFIFWAIGRWIVGQYRAGRRSGF